MFWSEKFVGVLKKFWVKKMLDPKKIWPQKIWGKKNILLLKKEFGSKKI